MRILYISSLTIVNFTILSNMYMPTLQQTQFVFEFLAWLPSIMLLMYMLLNEQRYVYVIMLDILKRMCLNLNGEKYLLLKYHTTL